MKKNVRYSTKIRLWWLLVALTGIIIFPANAQTSDASGAKRFAETFFKGSAPQFAPGKVAPKPVLEQRYQSASYKQTPLFLQSPSGIC